MQSLFDVMNHLGIHEKSKLPFEPLVVGMTILFSFRLSEKFEGQSFAFYKT